MLPCKVQRGYDRRLVADDLADAAEQVAFAILHVLDDHRPVQVQQHAVHRPQVRQPLQELALQSSPGVRFDRRRRLGKCPQHGRQLEIELLGAGDKSPGAGIDAAMHVNDLVAPQQPPPSLRKRLVRRRNGRKRARFVRDSANGNPHGQGLRRGQASVPPNRGTPPRPPSTRGPRPLPPSLPTALPLAPVRSASPAPACPAGSRGHAGCAAPGGADWRARSRASSSRS